MKRRFTVIAARLLDLLTDGAAAAMPRGLSRFFRLMPRRIELPRGGEVPTSAAGGPGPLQLVLHESDVYETVLPMPGKWSVDPWAVTEMQLHRLSPVKPELTIWDVGTGVGESGSEARLSLVRRDVVEKALARSRHVTSITADTGFAPEFLRLDPRRLKRRALRLLGLCLLLWLSLPLPLLLAYWLAERQTAILDARLSALSGDVKQTRQLRDRITFLAQDLDRTTALMAQPERRRILDELAMLLPDGSWIDDLSIRPDGIRLHGQSADATALLDRFRGDPLFADVHFTTPIVRAPGGTGETFALAMSIQGGKP